MVGIFPKSYVEILPNESAVTQEIVSLVYTIEIIYNIYHSILHRLYNIYALHSDNSKLAISNILRV